MTKQRRLRYDPYADYYVVLGLSPNASQDEVQLAYRQRAKKLHPDRNPDGQATTQFQLLNEAYDALSDPTQRANYDSLRARSMGGSFSAGRSAAAHSGSTTRATHWRRVISELWQGPYRYVFVMLGIVAVANVVFIFATRDNNIVPNLSPSPTSIPALIQAPDDLVNPISQCDPGALIISPANGVTVSGAFEVIGTTNGAYQVDWAAFNVDSTGRAQLFEWHPLGSGKTPITRNNLVTRAQTQAASLPASGRVRLRLVVVPGDDQPAQTCEETVTLKTAS